MDMDGMGRVEVKVNPRIFFAVLLTAVGLSTHCSWQQAQKKKEQEAIKPSPTPKIELAVPTP